MGCYNSPVKTQTCYVQVFQGSKTYIQINHTCFPNAPIDVLSSLILKRITRKCYDKVGLDGRLLD